MPTKRVGDRNIYLSHNNFGDQHKSWLMLPKIVDFGLAQSGGGKEPLRHPMQPPLYKAPEVLLGIPWSYSVDIWNLGVLVSISHHTVCTGNNRDMKMQLFELLKDKPLFSHLKSQNGVYTARAHLAEMIALLGPPPQNHIDEEKHWRDIPWDRSFPDSNNEWCDTAHQYLWWTFL